MVKQVVKVDWNDLKSINNAERRTSRLVNNGYTLTKTICGLTRSEFVYVKNL